MDQLRGLEDLRHRVGSLDFHLEGFREVHRLDLEDEVDLLVEDLVSSFRSIMWSNILILCSLAGFAPPPGFPGGPRKFFLD